MSFDLDVIARVAGTVWKDMSDAGVELDEDALLEQFAKEKAKVGATDNGDTDRVVSTTAWTLRLTLPFRHTPNAP